MANNNHFGGITYIKTNRRHPVWRARVVVNGQRHTQNFSLRADAMAWLAVGSH